jgi:selenide,water dikinase
MDSVPLLADVARLAGAGYITGASARNWMGYGDDVDLDPGSAKCSVRC